MLFNVRVKNTILACAVILLLLTLLVMQGYLFPNASAQAGRTDVVVSTASTSTLRSLWVGERKRLLSLSLDAGQTGLALPAEQLEDIAVDNDRSVVWVGTHKEIIQYTLDGKELYRYQLKHKNKAAASDREQKTTQLPDERHGERNEPDDDDKKEDHGTNRVHLSLDPSDGALWIGAGRAVIKLSSDHRELFTRGDLKRIADLSVDISSGSCWVGEARRITRYSSEGTLLFTATLEKDGKTMALASEPSSQAVWIGTNKGIIKLDAAGTELFRIDGPVHLKDLKTDTVAGSLWLVTNKKVYKYSKEGEPLFGVPVCSKDDSSDEKDHEKTDIEKNKNEKHEACEDGDHHDEGSDHEKCEGNLVTLAVDAVDGTCWVAWRKNLLKLNDKGEELFRVSGFKQIAALDIGIPRLGITITEPAEGTVITDYDTVTVKGTITDPTATVSVMDSRGTVSGLQFEVLNVPLSEGVNTLTVTATNYARQSASDTVHVTYQSPINGSGPALFLCPEPYGEQMPHPPVPGCAQQRMLGKLNYSEAYVFGTVDNTAEDVWVDGIHLPFGTKIRNRGRIMSALWTDTYFWAFIYLDGPDGDYPVSVESMNESEIMTTATVTFTKDTVYPQVILTEPVDEFFTKSRTFVMSGTVDDPTAIVQNSWTGEVIPVVNGKFSTLFELEPIEELQYASIWAIDPANNIGSDYRRVTLDTTLPQITVIAPAAGAAVKVSNVNVWGTVVDQNLDILTVSVNSWPSQWLPCTGIYFNGMVGLSSGTNTLVFQAKDKAGNTSEISHTIIRDQVPPVVSITSPLSDSIISGAVTVSVSASDSLSDIQSVVFLMDGLVQGTRTEAPYTFDLDTSLFTLGSHTLTAKATDKAGNLSETGIPITINNPLGIEITEPASGVTINKASVIVKGKIRNATTETGVVINGMLAQVNGDDFAAIVPLQEGANSIAVTAAGVDGQTAQTGITINTTTPEESLRLTVYPASGIMTTDQNNTTSFDANLEVTTYLQDPIASYSWDINGDSIPDQAGTVLTQITATYLNPGLYFPAVRVTDTMGRTYMDTTIVNVQDVNEMNSAFKTIWDRMKTALLAGEITTALADYSENTRARYEQVFTQLINTNSVVPIYSNIADIVVNNINSQIAECWALRQEGDGTHAYPITYVKDITGIWKIMGY